MISTSRGIQPYFFMGVVEDKDDPINAGRIRVRVFGVHESNRPDDIRNDKVENNVIEDQDLPWAYCINGAYGKMNMVPDEGEWVFGFFADGRDAQHPFIIGVIPGQNLDDFGYADPVEEQTVSNTNKPVQAGGEISTSDADIGEVVQTGNGYNVVKLADGTVVRRQGARNWRNHNPGNLESGAFAESMGAVGTDGRFAIFPSYEAGRRAKEKLLFETSSYKDLPLAQAISRYAPSFENTTSAYIENVAEASGIDPSTPMSAIPSSVRDDILNAFERQEGFSEGKEIVYG